LKELQFVDTSHGWMLERTDPCGFAELPFNCFDLLASTDGGLNWRTILSRLKLKNLRFVDREHGWALAMNTDGRTTDAIATADGGASWHAQIAGEPLVSLAVPNAATAIALSLDGGYCTASLCLSYGLFRVVGGRLETVHDTKPTGWSAGRPGCGGHLREMFFVDEHRGWIGLLRGAGNAGFRPAGLIATTDGGLTWTCVDSLPPQDVIAIHFSDTAHGWVTTRVHSMSASIGTMRLWRTDDGGLSWRLVLA
jgi:photosystem II stability/assembly factor-like uncharacterized protein